jgi:hypothetical protein
MKYHVPMLESLAPVKLLVGCLSCTYANLCGGRLIRSPNRKDPFTFLSAKSIYLTTLAERSAA